MYISRDCISKEEYVCLHWLGLITTKHRVKCLDQGYSASDETETTNDNNNNNNDDDHNNNNDNSNNFWEGISISLNLEWHFHAQCSLFISLCLGPLY